MRRMTEAVLALLLAATAARAEPTGPQPKLPTAPLTIVGAGGTRHDFTVELAATAAQQETGEMFRKEIPQGQGMFFDWGEPRPMSMWMKNCPVPEDMIFIDATGRITHIAENTVPFSEANIPSGGAVRATLEVAGGTTAALGIAVGDRVQGVIFH